MKKRTLTLELTDAEMITASCQAAGIGITLEKLLEWAIADLTRSDRSGGSDERCLIHQWIDRRSIGYDVDTLLQYVLRFGELEDIRDACEGIDACNEDLECAEEEEKEAIREEIAHRRKQVRNIYEAYEKYAKKHGRQAGPFGAEIDAVKTFLKSIGKKDE